VFNIHAFKSMDIKNIKIYLKNNKVFIINEFAAGLID